MLRFDFQADFDWKCDCIIIPLGLGQQDKSAPSGFQEGGCFHDKCGNIVDGLEDVDI